MNGDAHLRYGKRLARRRERGVALILVLGALTILTVMLTESQDESSADFAAALATRDQLVAEYAAKSGVNLSRLLIAAEPTIRTAIGPILGLLFGGTVPQLPVWDHAPRVLGAFNDKDGAADFATLSGLDVDNGQNLGFDGAGFDIDIVDEDSKIDVNSVAAASSFAKARLGAQLAGLMAGPQYDALFSNHDADGQYSDRITTCGAIIDFIDSDQDDDRSFCDPTSMTAQQSGAEDGFYQSLKQPYERKNAALDSFEELHRVRGMSEDFWSTFVDPDPDDPRKRTLTVWGQGTVNVNTANPQTLYALICSPSNVDVMNTPMCHDPNEAAKFLGAFAMVRAFTRGAPLFGSPDLFVSSMQGKGLFGPVLAALGMQPVVFKSNNQLKQQMSTESKVFSIYSTGHVNSGGRKTRLRLHVVVDFRGAPAPGVNMSQLNTAAAAEAAISQATGAGAMTTTAGSTGGTGTVAQAIQAVMKPSPGGNIVYFRMD
ncbi:MAG TPA: type II secretion system protein GspK [Polyangiaceae bacterium]|nr:type II secretion system protein GspK [Polyangiaceae bacterium]